MRLLAASFAASLLFTSTASAEDEAFEPGALGMGGAVRTLGGDITAVRVNASTMTSQPNYIAGMSYSYYGREKSHLWVSGAMDSKTSEFALGSTYSLRSYEPPFDAALDLSWYRPDDAIRDVRKTHRWDVAAAYGFIGRRLNVGLTARILRHDNRIRPDTTRFSFDAGVSLWPAQVLGIQASAQNIVPTKDDRFPTRLSAGLGLRVPQVIDVGFDIVWDMTSAAKPTTDIHAGAALRFLQYLAIRGGFYSERKFRDTYATWGLGLDLQRLRVDFGMRIEVGALEKRLREGKPEANNRFWNSIGFHLTF